MLFIRIHLRFKYFKFQFSISNSVENKLLLSVITCYDIPKKIISRSFYASGRTANSAKKKIANLCETSTGYATRIGNISEAHITCTSFSSIKI